MKTLFSLVLLLVVFPAILVTLSFALFCVNPVSPQQTKEVAIEIMQGSSLRTIASLLEDAHAIKGKWRFKLLAKLLHVERSLKYGEYRLKLPQTPLSVLQELASGNVTAYFVTFPEGSSMFDVAQHIENAGLCSAAAILEKAADREFAAALGIDGESLEGYLFPETYKFNRGSSPTVILRRMVEQFNKIVTSDMEKQARAIGLTRKEFVTLASLVEKETGREEERAVIAAVFLNRLQKGMRLDCDPTVIYGLKLENSTFNERLNKNHLKKESPYNTYRNSGLPPGPICNPGLNSIRAVLNPAKVNYFYFVSKNDGTHQFSETLAEHNQAVNAYQRQQ
jgi:UPF0755 protein